MGSRQCNWKSVTYSPTSSTTYTVTGLLAGCATTATNIITINTTAPTWALVSNPPSGICPAYSSATINAYGTATSYTWSTGANTQSISVSPASTTVYTVTGADALGCTSSATYTLFVSTGCNTCAVQSGSVLPSVCSNVFVSGGSYAVNSDVIINGYTEFDQVELQIAPGVTFSVAPTSTLILGGCHLYSCFDMWSGIKLSPTARIVINNGTVIEDAEIAIKSNNSSLTTGSIIAVQEAIFNRNNTAISISNYTPSISPYPFYIKKTIFTSRDFSSAPTAWPQYGLLTQTCTPANALGTPYCFQNFPAINMKSPNNATSASIGVAIYTVGATLNPSTTPTYYSIQIGDHTNTSHINVFDNLLIGISAIDANVKVYQNIFQNSNYRTAHGFFDGVGVDHSSTDGYNNYLTLKAPHPFSSLRKNRFYDCTFAVKTNNTFELDAQYMVIQSTQTASANYQRGKFGVYSTSNRFRQYDVQQNLIYNIEHGITFNSTYGPITFGASTYTNTQYSGLVYLNMNTIAPVISGAIGNEFVTNAITAANVLSSGSTSSLTSNSQVNASGNILRNVYNAISASNFYTPAFMAQNNTCTLSLDPSGATQLGIAITTCSNASVQTNVIVGPGTTNTITTGIYAADNNAPKVTCNTVQATYQGFEFSGNQPGTKWKGNSMTSHIRGFVLNNSGVIGTQGSSVSPMDNSWNGTWTIGTHFQSWTDNGTFASGSPLYTQSVSPYVMPSLLNDGFPTFDSYQACCTNTATGAYSCAGGGARLITSDPDYENAYFKLLEDIAGYSVFKNNIFDQSNYIAQFKLYRLLDTDPTLYASNTILYNFYQSNKNSGYGKLMDGENELIKGNFNSAVSFANSIAGKNNIESNYHDFYNLYKKYYTQSYDATDNKSLLALANKCPFTEGEVVYQARALYNVVNSTVTLFKNNCPVNSSSRLHNSSTSSGNWNAEIYPNPVSNEIFIKTNNAAEELKVIITDVNGKKVGDYRLRTIGSIGNIKLDLNSGIYFVILSNQNNEKTVKKLVISK